MIKLLLSYFSSVNQVGTKWFIIDKLSLVYLTVLNSKKVLKSVGDHNDFKCYYVLKSYGERKRVEYTDISQQHIRVVEFPRSHLENTLAYRH